LHAGKRVGRPAREIEFRSTVEVQTWPEKQRRIAPCQTEVGEERIFRLRVQPSLVRPTLPSAIHAARDD
jgi:hypothetical protein